MVPLMEENAQANGFDGRGRDTAGGQGTCECRELTWGGAGYEERAGNLGPADWVIAADCVYVDGEGESPSVPAFVESIRRMSGPGTTVVVCQEVRSTDVSATLRRLLEENFKTACRLVPPQSLPAPLRAEYNELFVCKL